MMSMISIKRVGLACILAVSAGFDLHAATTLNLGSTYTDTIGVPGQTNLYTFTGSSGQRLYFDSLDADNLSINATLLSPGGVNLYERNDDYDSGPLVLTEPGTYSLVFNGNGATTGSYTFRLLDLSAAAPLTLGTTLSDSLNPPLACNTYQFTGTHGQRIKLQSVTSSANQAQWELLTPANVVLVSGQINQSLGTVTLPIDGPYCLLVIGTTAGSTPLTFQLLLSDVSDTPVAASGFGTPHSGTVGANQTNSFSYTASAGLPVYFNSLDRSGQLLEVDLLDPTGGVVFAVGETADAGPYVLPRSGTYTLNVRGPGGGSGNFNFRLLDLTTSPVLLLNTNVSNVLAMPYQTDVYQFSGNAGQRLYYDALTNTPGYLPLLLLGPDGQTPITGNLYADAGPATLPYPGTYYLFLKSSLSTAPGYQFQMLDIGAQPALPLNTILSGTLASDTTLIYQLAGTSGEQLYFNGSGVSSFGASWALYDARNNTVSGSGASISGDFNVVLPYTCNYALVMAGVQTPAPYSNQVTTVSYSTNALTLGLIENNTIVHSGDQLVYTFTGTAGQRVYYDALNASYSSINVTLVSPTGVTVTSGIPFYDFGPVTLIESGTYMLIFSGNGHTTGPISFRLFDLATQPALPLNTDLTGSLAANSSLVYTLAGSAGQQLYFYGKGVSAGGGTWTLYGPDNSSAMSANLSGDFELTLANSGNYALVLAAGANALTYSNQVSSFSYTTNPLTLGTEVTSTIVHPGDQLYYTFNGVAGQRLYFDSRQTNYLNVSVTLLSPTGGVIPGNIPSSVTSDAGPFTLIQSGTYSLVLSGSGHTTGVVSFNLLDLSAAPLVTVGSTIADALSDQTETRLYQFAGTAGQRVNLQTVGPGSNKATWELLGLQDQTLGSSSYLSGNLGMVTLPVAGKYVVAVVGAGSVISPVSYQLSLTDVSDSTVASGGFGTIHSGNISANQTNSFTYTASAGLPVFFDSQDTSGRLLMVDLMAPDGSAVFSVGETSDAGPYTLPRSGTYTLNVRSANGGSGNYNFRLLDLSVSPPLPLNTPMSGTLSNSYETDVYQITNSSGQAFIYDALTNDANYPSLYVELFDPRWQTVLNVDFQTDHGPFNLQYAGTSYFALRNNQGVASSYSFQFLDVASQPALPINTSVTNTLGVYPLEVYSYAGTAGQKIFFAGQSLNPSGNWTLYDANSSTVPGASGGLAGGFKVTLPSSGTYALVLSSSSSTAGTEIFQANTFLYFTNNYTMGTPTTDVISKPGEQHFYAFNGTLGQRLIYNALTGDPPSPNYIYVQLLNPQGNQEGPISGSRFSFNQGPFTLQQSGLYTLELYGNSASVGPFAFQLLDVSSQPVLPVGTGVTNIIDVFPLEVYQYPGLAGQHLYFRGLSGNPSGSWTLYDPNNNPVPYGNSSLAGDFEVTLSISGTYVLVLRNSSGTAGTEVFAINLFNSGGTVPTGLQMVTVLIGPGTATPVWQSTPGKHYRLQYKNNLADPTWTAVGADVTATDMTTSQIDSSIGANATRFYRVEALD